jgi:hypothetical protein
MMKLRATWAAAKRELQRPLVMFMAGVTTAIFLQVKAANISQVPSGDSGAGRTVVSVDDDVRECPEPC